MLADFLSQHLETENVTVAEFKELVIRLMNYGVLCRDESQTEQQLYDRYLRIADWVDDYLALSGVRLYHDSRFGYLRLYPPASRVPGMEDEEESAFGGSLRARLGQQEVALVLVLRIQYDKALREGNVDEYGYVAESIESLSIALKNILGRTLPETKTERRHLFQRLRQLRLIHYRQEEELDSGEAWLKIHPMIVSFVNDEALVALEDDAATSGPDEPASSEHTASEEASDAPSSDIETATYGYSHPTA